MATTDYFVVCIRRKTVLFGETVALLPRVKDLASKGVFMQQICLDALILLRLLEYCKLAWYKHAERRHTPKTGDDEFGRKKEEEERKTVATQLPLPHAFGLHATQCERREFSSNSWIGPNVNLWIYFDLYLFLFVLLILHACK